MKLFRDILIYQAVWLVSVLAGAWGAGWIGLVAVSALAIVFADSPARIAIWLLAGLIAWSSDAAVGWLGGVVYAHHAPNWLPSPLWMLALWMNFAVMADPILSFLRGRFAVGAAIGAVGGPLAYAGAAGLGAVSIPKLFTAMPLVALQFAIFVPLLISVSRPKSPVGPAAGGSAG